jgi:hypothetical protein
MYSLSEDYALGMSSSGSIELLGQFGLLSEEY